MSAPERWSERDHKGSIVRMTALSGEKPINTKYGQKWAITARVEVLEGTWAGTTYRNALIFHAEIKRQVLKHGKYIGRLGQATYFGKPAWVLLSERKAA